MGRASVYGGSEAGDELAVNSSFDMDESVCPLPHCQFYRPAIAGYRPVATDVAGMGGRLSRDIGGQCRGVAVQ